MTEAERRINIVAVLKRAGVNIWGSGDRAEALCPFHRERTPSFKVTPSKGLWHCFGCRAGGTAVSFIEQRYRVNREEARAMLRAWGELRDGTQDVGQPRSQTSGRDTPPLGAIYDGPGAPGSGGRQMTIDVEPGPMAPSRIDQTRQRST